MNQNYQILESEIKSKKTITGVENHIQKILEECEFSQIKASEMLGIHRNTLSRKIKEYHIEIPK